MPEMETDRPNILLIFTDQHRLSALGCYGETPCQTPNIDRLAAEGARFETAYTSCPVCSPARASVMTGLHVHRHGVLCNCNDLPTPVKELPDGPHLLSRRLGAAGYRCGHVGKWHLGARSAQHFGLDLDRSHPTTRGFEWPSFFGYEEYLEEAGLDPQRTQVDGRLNAWRLQGPREASMPYWLAEQATHMIDDFAGDERPFFIWYCEPGPHAAYQAPAEILERYEGVRIPRWPNYEWDSLGTNRPHQVKIPGGLPDLTWEDWERVIRVYYALATDIDEQVGRIMDHLEERGLADNTVVIFTSDHGQTLGSHGGLIDKGWHHFEEIQRIGMILRDAPGRGAGGREPGTVLGEWASILDLYPTILDLAGAEYDASHVDGSSLLPLLDGDRTDWRDTHFVEFWGVNGLSTTMVTCRHGEMKYGWNCGNWDELYDLAADPHEMQNVIDEPGYADSLEALRGKTIEFMEKTNHPGSSRVRDRSLWAGRGRDS